jgi:glycosyltransferase involved in cell wall biosynthesis
MSTDGYGRSPITRSVERADSSGTRARSRSVSLVIPTYNERENVRAVVDQCAAALAGYDFEIVIVDDDSPDGTWRIARRTYAADDRVRVVRRTDVTGLATAISRGFAEASAEFCAVIDADLQHPPEKLPALIDAFDPGVDVVIASRYVEGGGIERWSPMRRIVSRGAARLAKIGLPAVHGIADPLSGFFAVRRSVLRDVALSPIGYKILLEVLVKCEYNGVAEIPYVFTERTHGESKLTGEEYLAFLRHVSTLRLAQPPWASLSGSEADREREDDVVVANR